MSNQIQNYRNVVDQPWGRMFYDLIYNQLDLPNEKRLKILDFGAGFCLTADHYAEHHDVTAAEPNKEMVSLRVRSNNYTLIPKGTEFLSAVADNTYDVVICHNVLEYVDDIDYILIQLERVLKPGGILSIVKHNDLGRAMGYAVLNDNPKAALDLLSKDQAESSMFGDRSVYSNEYLVDFLADQMVLKDVFGIRTFYGLSSNNEIKFTSDWYQSMLALETKAATMDEYRKIAFFNHLVFIKSSDKSSQEMTRNNS